MSEFNNIINEICSELNIKLTLLSDGWVKVLEKNSTIKYIEGNHFSLNHQAVGNIMNDKGLFYELLINNNYPIISHKVVFKDTSKKEIIDFFESNSRNIVVKGNVGMCGKEVFLINEKNELLNVINKLLETQYSISLCPYYDILNEYRVIVLDNEVQLVYGKIRPKVVGDGVSNLKKLAFNFNKDYFDNEKNLNFDIDYIPKINEEVLLNFQFNLSRGSKSFLEINDILKNKIIDLALNVSKKLNITFASIDIVETNDHELLIMEANSGVALSKFIKQHDDGYIIAYNIYKKAVIKMFEV